MPSIIYVSDQSLHHAFLLGVEVACFGAGQVRQTRGQRSPHKAAEQEIVSIFKAVRRRVSGLKDVAVKQRVMKLCLQLHPLVSKAVQVHLYLSHFFQMFVASRQPYIAVSRHALQGTSDSSMSSGNLLIGFAAPLYPTQPKTLLRVTGQVSPTITVL